MIDVKPIFRHKYLQILSSFCICHDRTIINNQINVIKIFFQQIREQNNFKLSLEKADEK